MFFTLAAGHGQEALLFSAWLVPTAFTAVAGESILIYAPLLHGQTHSRTASACCVHPRLRRMLSSGCRRPAQSRAEYKDRLDDGDALEMQ